MAIDPTPKYPKNFRKRLTKEEEKKLQGKVENLYAKGYAVRLICRELNIREEVTKRLLWNLVSEQGTPMPRTKYLFTAKDTIAKVFNSDSDYTAEISTDGTITLTPLTPFQEH